MKMRNGKRKTTGRLVKLTSVILAFAGLAGMISGCKDEKKPSGPQTGILQSGEPGPETSAAETVSDKPLVISEMQEMQVQFGRITDNVGYYKLGLSDKDAPQYVLQGRYIYCLSGSRGNYTFRRINTEDLDRSHVCTIKINSGNAALLDYGIKCNVNDETVFLDFNLHEIYRTRVIGDEQVLFPYKDGYIIKDGADLRILHLDDEKPYRTLNSRDYLIKGYHSTGDNTYLILKNKNNPESKTCAIYDINRKVYWKRIPDNVALCDIGMVSRASGKYTISNFAKMNSSTAASKNPCKYSSSIFDGSKQYFFDEADRKIKYYVPSKQKICILSDAEFTVGASLKGLYGNYLFAQYANSMYFIDTAGLKEQTADSYIKKLKKDVANMKKNLEFHYRIKILYGKDALKPAAKEAKLEALTYDEEILYSMNKLSSALKKFNYKFFDEFKWTKKDGICILLSGNIDTLNEKQGVEGLSFTGDKNFYIALNVRSEDISAAFCREIMHTIEHRMVDPDLIFVEWNNYNPEGFAYSELSAGSPETPYVPENEADPAKVYFTDSYACASPSEDRARLFAAMFMPESFGKNISDYPCLMSKAAGLKHILQTYYPSLSGLEALKNIR